MNRLVLSVALVLKLRVVVSSVLGDQFSEQDARVWKFFDSACIVNLMKNADCNLGLKVQIYMLHIFVTFLLGMRR